MAVYQPSKGDLWDRLLVLELKIRFGWAAAKDVRHFRKEAAGIEQILRPTYRVEALGKLVANMAQVHQRLWDATSRKGERYAE